MESNLSGEEDLPDDFTSGRLYFHHDQDRAARKTDARRAKRGERENGDELARNTRRGEELETERKREREKERKREMDAGATCKRYGTDVTDVRTDEGGIEL